MFTTFLSCAASSESEQLLFHQSYHNPIQNLNWILLLCSRYCGEVASLSLTSDTNVLVVKFHSDRSHTDKGFSAEYSSYDPSNRKSCLSTKFTQHVVLWVKCLSQCDGWRLWDCTVTMLLDGNWLVVKLFIVDAFSSVAGKLKSESNHWRAYLLTPFYLSLSVRSTSLSILSTLCCLQVWLKWVYNCSDQQGQALAAWLVLWTCITLFCSICHYTPTHPCFLCVMG